MSLWESGESNGSVSLASMFDGEMKAATADAKTIEELSFLICRGWLAWVIDTEAKSCAVAGTELCGSCG